MLMAHATETWTLEQLHRLPDDGNRYELVDGELFVTPAPSPAHERLVSLLRSLLEPYVRMHRLGELHGPRGVVCRDDSEVEPDLRLLPPMATTPDSWAAAPVPLLVVEVLSRTTSRRDNQQKRAFYLRIGIPKYWIVSGAERTIRVVKAHGDDAVTGTELVWHPSGASEPLVIDVESYFDGVVG